MTKTVKVKLDTPIGSGETKISELTLRKPAAGELRGLSLLELAQVNTDALIKLIPRIATPIVTEAEVATIDMGDMFSLGVEVAAFLSKKG